MHGLLGGEKPTTSSPPRPRLDLGSLVHPFPATRLASTYDGGLFLASESRASGSRHVQSPTPSTRSEMALLQLPTEILEIIVDNLVADDWQRKPDEARPLLRMRLVSSGCLFCLAHGERF
jgi:hypothetical protein